MFFVGLLLRAIFYVRGLDKLERVAYTYHADRSIPGALTSIFKWLIPGGTCGWRAQPVATLLFFLLHCGAVLIPLFLLGHTVLLEYYTGISLPALPGALADILSIAAVVGLVLLALRRLAVPALRQLNSGQDWFILLLTFLPFATGLMARLNTASYESWMIAHVLCGELFLILAPFTSSRTSCSSSCPAPRSAWISPSSAAAPPVAARFPGSRAHRNIFLPERANTSQTLCNNIPVTTKEGIL